jgi:gluconolactonase
MGKIFYLAPGAKNWVEVADNLNYANGIGVSPDQKTLYVSETVGNCILKFDINPDGSLSHRANFALLNLLTKNKVDSWWIGPDSMKVDAKGNIYVAQWSGGKVLKISPAGKLLHVFNIAAGNGTTNVAFGEGEKDLYVTVVKDPNDPKAAGCIVKIPERSVNAVPKLERSRLARLHELHSRIVARPRREYLPHSTIRASLRSALE